MPTLSHYTSRAGLEGIALGKSLRATRFSDLNDKREVAYGLTELSTRALRAAYSKVEKLLKPEDARLPLDYIKAGAQIAEHFRASFDGDRGSEPLYLVSFARGSTEDHEQRGMLTLWDRYTRLEGYCLQFDSEEIDVLLRREFAMRNYAILELSPVHYGIDETDQEYQQLLFQHIQRLLIEVEAAKPGLCVKPEYEKLWALGALALRTLRFHARHKDPFFEDERETRIMAVPAKQSDSRVLFGPALRKEVHMMPDGRHFIDIGADWRPGIEPRRIIVGPKASRDLDGVLALFDRQPNVVIADFPIRA
jgi:hypothetical protein